MVETLTSILIFTGAAIVFVIVATSAHEVIDLKQLDREGAERRSKKGR